MLVESPYLAVCEDLAEALAVKSARPEAEIIGGGLQLLADHNLGIGEPSGYVVIGRVAELAGVAVTDDVLTIGATTTIRSLLTPEVRDAAPLLFRASQTFGTRQTRNRGTVGGNVATALPDRTLPPCLLALEATVTLASVDGERTIPIGQLCTPDGTSTIASNEILTKVAVPLVAGYQNYTMIGPRNAQFFPTVSVALVLDERNRNIRIGLGNAAPSVIRASEAEAVAGASVDWDSGLITEAAAVEAGRIAAENAEPPSDSAGSSDYRRHAISVIVRRMLIKAFDGSSK